MTPEQLVFYGLGALLIIFARVRHSALFRARSIKGSVIVTGNNHGTITNTYTEGTVRPAGSDHVSWAIGIVGVLITLAQLAHDIFWAK